MSLTNKMQMEIVYSPYTRDEIYLKSIIVIMVVLNIRKVCKLMLVEKMTEDIPSCSLR